MFVNLLLVNSDFNALVRWTDVLMNGVSIPIINAVVSVLCLLVNLVTFDAPLGDENV